MDARWQQLMTTTRPYTSSRGSSDERSDFERDYDRLIFASPFRRLQDKAQVFPLEHNDFVRTRLTHSLEVSTLGRSLGRQVARRLSRERGIELSSDDVGTVVATVCLAHDIGNPPFGHFGEDSIRRWFAGHQDLLTELSEAERQDFLQFDGNAQGLRILTYLQSLVGDNGLNLTYTTLAAFMKYLPPSDGVVKEIKPLSKVGYFQSEKGTVEGLRDALQLGNHRHPLVFLMEAADDIAYSVVDIEDGLKKGVLRHDELIEMLEEDLRGSEHLKLVESFKKSCHKDKDRPLSERVTAAIQWFRIGAIGAMFQEAVEMFLLHHDAILAGTFHQELIRASDSAYLLSKTLTRIAAARVYNAPQVLALEVFGDRVIHELLDRFVPASLSDDRLKQRTLDGKLYAMMSPSMRALLERNPAPSPYSRIQLAVDHICGMTDTYAVGMYRKLTGTG